MNLGIVTQDDQVVVRPPLQSPAAGNAAKDLLWSVAFVSDNGPVRHPLVRGLANTAMHVAASHCTHRRLTTR
jgi:hypothetical protein